MARLRFFSFFFLFFGVVFMPLWLFLCFFSLCVAFFPKFWEGLFFGFLLDALYPAPAIFSKIDFAFFFIIFLLMILFAEKLRPLIHGENLLSKIFTAVFFVFSFGVIFLFVSFLN